MGDTPQSHEQNGTLWFSDICSLLDALEELFDRYQSKSKLSKRDFRARRTKLVEQWVRHYQLAILRNEKQLIATLSLLFPGLRRERVYTMKETRLAEVIAQAIGCGSEDLQLLANWRSTHKDFGSAAQSVMKRRVHSFRKGSVYI